MALFEVQMSATITTYRIVKVHGHSLESARKRALDLTSESGNKIPQAEEEVGDWCDSTMPSRRRVQWVRPVGG